ncbi:hypothetical protein NX059_008911 [Plenodomus lindquistii]|nr:hypothetical protein NX059_008911 [Plenodomus lindquistii]
MPPSPQESDPFDTLLTLEDTLYTSAYTLGASDGAHAGRIEGRIFGLEKGFEKFTSLGHLHGRSVVWGARLASLRPSLQPPPASQQQNANESPATHTYTNTPSSKPTTTSSKPTPQSTPPAHQLPDLSTNERLRNNITLLHSLTDLDTFSTANEEDAVADFDDRVKRAGAKAKVVERIVGEMGMGGEEKLGRGAKGGGVRVSGEGRGKGGDGSMEDFAGSRLVR